jgi:hypothetical protein
LKKKLSLYVVKGLSKETSEAARKGLFVALEKLIKSMKHSSGKAIKLLRERLSSFMRYKIGGSSTKLSEGYLLKTMGPLIAGVRIAFTSATITPDECIVIGDVDDAQSSAFKRIYGKVGVGNTNAVEPQRHDTELRLR